MVVIHQEEVVEVAPHLLGRRHAGVDIKLRPLREGGENPGQHIRLDLGGHIQLRPDPLIFCGDRHEAAEIGYHVLLHLAEGVCQQLHLIPRADVRDVYGGGTCGQLLLMVLDKGAGGLRQLVDGPDHPPPHHDQKQRQKAGRQGRQQHGQGGQEGPLCVHHLIHADVRHHIARHGTVGVQHRCHGRHQPAKTFVPLDNRLNGPSGQKIVQIFPELSHQIHIGSQGAVAAVLIRTALSRLHIGVKEEGDARPVGANHIEILHIVAVHHVPDKILGGIVVPVHLAGLIIVIQFVRIQLGRQGTYQVGRQPLIIARHGGTEHPVAGQNCRKAQDHTHQHNEERQFLSQRELHLGTHVVPSLKISRGQCGMNPRLHPYHQCIKTGIPPVEELLRLVFDHLNPQRVQASAVLQADSLHVQVKGIERLCVIAQMEGNRAVILRHDGKLDISLIGGEGLYPIYHRASG